MENNMFAVVKTGGKQYKVSKDDKLIVEKIEGDDGSAITLDNVLFVFDGKKATIGEPAVAGAIVKAKIIRQTRGEKVVVFKKRRRQNYRRKAGHKQDLTLIQITDIKAA
jgi:large subunit ribosomal protein L21